MNKKIDSKDLKTCEICGKYILGDTCVECAENERNIESKDKE